MDISYSLARKPSKSHAHKSHKSNQTRGNKVLMIKCRGRCRWMTRDNKFRKEYGIKCIPTITKVVDVSYHPHRTRDSQDGTDE